MTISNSRSTVTLSINGTGAPAMRTYSFEVLLDGQTLQSQQSLSPVESQEISEISRQYEHLFEKQCSPEAASDYLELLGSGLFHLWFETVWGQIMARTGGRRVELTVSSDLPEVLGLPWELVHPPDGEMLGFDLDISIRRRPASVLPTSAPQASAPQASAPQASQTGKRAVRELPPPPLRVLFMACGPKASMDCPAEEAGFYRALEGLGAIIDAGDLGTFEELRQRVREFRPQAVHLAGEALSRDGQAYFAFEGSSGMADLKRASDIMQILSGQGVQCLLLSGCHSKSHASMEIICLDLARLGAPVAIAWAGSMAEGQGQDLIRVFYQSLASGEPVSSAIVRASSVVGKSYRDHSSILAFPALYSASGEDLLYDPSKEPKSFRPLINGQSPLWGISDGYARDFINRRREMQRLLPALREGTIRAVVLTGPDGMGKSTMALRLANEMSESGFILIALRSSRENPLTAARLVHACQDALSLAVQRYGSEGDDSRAGLFRDALQRLGDPRTSADERLREAVASMNQGRFCLLLDDFHSNLDGSGRILDTGISRFYAHMLNHLTSSRAIVVSQRLPEDLMTLPSRVWEHSLAGLSPADFFRIVIRDEAAAARYGSGEIGYGLVIDIHASVAGMPRCLGLIPRALGMGVDIRPGAALCQDLYLSIYGMLSPDSRKALSRAAVFNVPVNLSGLKAVTGVQAGVLEDMAREWHGLGLAFWRDGMLAISSDLRLWLLGQIDDGERLKAQIGAGDFYRELSRAKRSGEIGLSRLECMIEARSEYLAAGSAERAIDITDRLSSFLMLSGIYEEIQRLNHEVLDRFGHPRALDWMARACLEQGMYKEAQDLYQRCLDQASGDKESAGALYGLAITDLRQGRYDLARKGFEEASGIYRRIGDLIGEASSVQGLASIDMAEGKNQNAREGLERVLEMQEALMDKSGQASTLHDLISLDLRQADYAAAREKLDRSLSLFQEIGDRGGEASVLSNMASIDLEMGEIDIAVSEFQRSLEIRQSQNDRAGQASVLHSLGMIDLKAGSTESARLRFMRALKIYQELGDKPGEAAAFFQLGVMAVQGRHAREGVKLLALSGMILKSADHPDFREVEPVVDRLASQLKYSPDQFMRMVREISDAYRRDRGSKMVEMAFREG